MSSPTVINKSFTDSEEWSAALSDWNLEFRQLDCGPLKASIGRVMGTKIAIQRVQLSRRFHQSGIAPQGVLTFGIPDRSETIKWQGSSAQQRSMMNFSRRNGFDAVSEAGFAANTFSIASTAFQQEASTLDLPTSVDQVTHSADQFMVSIRDLDRMRTLADGLLTVAARENFSEDVAAELQNDLIHILVQSVASPDAEAAKTNYTQRHQAVNRALELIRTNTNTNSLGEIYEYAGVSYRTLNRAFRERFGVGPKQYVVAMRLAGARRTLLNSKVGVRITDIASDWGFWHLGRFAKDYRRMFGELPSETLINRVK